MTTSKLVWATNKYRLYLTNIKPAATRFTLKEKFGYLAVFWGVPIIGLSGMILWGEEIFTKIFPGNFLNFCLIAHSDEALLATIVIFVWHLYNTHLKLENFPMGMSWFTGFKKESEVEEEHYGYYQGVMQAEGHSPRHGQHAARPSRLRLALRKIAAAVVLVFLTASTAYLSWIVFYTVFGFHMRSVEHIPEKHHLSPPKLLEEIILEGKGEKNFYRGYRLTREQEIRDHSHNITMQVEPDRRSHCISCHGDFPHGKSAEIRAYLNMHDYFLACETCHAKPLAEGQRYTYRWYEKKSGEPLDSTPTITHNIDALGIKLVPGTGTADSWQRLDSDERIAYAARFLEQVNAGRLSKSEKKEGIAAIHEHISEETITCIQCHTEKAPLIPFETIGYSPDEHKHLCAEDVISVINGYSQFFLRPFSISRSTDYSPFVYCGLKRPAFKGRSTIVILNTVQLCLRVQRLRPNVHARPNRTQPVIQHTTILEVYPLSMLQDVNCLLKAPPAPGAAKRTLTSFASNMYAPLVYERKIQCAGECGCGPNRWIPNGSRLGTDGRG